MPIFDSPIQEFLRQTIVDAPYLYVDLWSLIHFSSGLIIGLLMAKFYQAKKAWLVGFGLLAGYEIIELFLIGILFIGETVTDVVWDLIIGMTGFTIAYQMFKKRK